MSIGFTNSFTSGEISEDGWDRIDIQPVIKGCEEATNYVIRIAGPLGKRRGFWRIADVADQTKTGRLIPFIRGNDDALMLEFGDLTVRVWQADGSPLMSGMAQVSFDSPYTEAQLDGLRYKQVVDVVYLRHRDGLAPQSLERISNISWAFNAESLPNGPWLAENIDLTFTITPTGSDEGDTNPHSTSGSILTGQAVTLTASAALFDPLHVGGTWRLRQPEDAPSVWSWAPGNSPPTGWYALSNGRVYCTTSAEDFTTDDLARATTPLVVREGSQSDGLNTFEYRHDGAGVVLIGAYVSATEVTGTVVATIPLKSGQTTSYWAEGAYSDFRGWPRAWPEMVEERLAEGATADNLDFIDMTETAGFYPAKEGFSPGLGTGLVTDVNALRRRLGADGGEVIWFKQLNFLIAGTSTGEHVISGGLFGAPLAPSSIICRQLSDFGSADVAPAKAHKGLFFVATGAQTLRRLAIDMQQSDTGDDLTVLAQHIAQRKFAQLAWVRQPDEALWARLGDGGLAVLTNHAEQQVTGWTRQAIPGGFIVEDIATMPGPGKFETLWMIVSRTKDAATQRQIWMQSQASDVLFIDGAAFYSGDPVTEITGLDHYEGETVRILADGFQLTDAPVVDGTVTFAAAGVVQVGLAYQTRFKSLKLATQTDGAINTRQRITGAIVSLKTVKARVVVDGSKNGEVVKPSQAFRTAGVDPPPIPKRIIQATNLGADASRDPRLVVEEDTAYDMVIYSLRPQVAPNG